MALSVKHEYLEWLDQYHWTWFVTLTLREGIRRKSANRLVREWITLLEESEGAVVSWIRMAEFGGELGTLHFHALVAGVHGTTISQAEALWKRMAGRAMISPYDPSRRGLEYTLKSMENSPDYDFDASLHDQHLRSRMRCGFISVATQARADSGQAMKALNISAE
jgi:hypothetical protein